MKIFERLIRKFRGKSPFSSREYWEQRYQSGGNSGQGSYGKMAEFKAGTVNDIVSRYGIRSVIDFGCGDGNQLTLSRYPKYTGLDVSRTSIELCKQKFLHDNTKSFFFYDPDYFVNHGALAADLALSMEVIFHLIEDGVYENYIQNLIAAADKYILVFSTCRDQPVHRDVNGQVVAHVRHRDFVKDMQQLNPGIEIQEVIDNIIEGKEDIKFYLLTNPK